MAAPITGGRHRVFVDLRRYVVYVIWHNSGTIAFME
ncbi:hypothetical protein KPNJ2_00625 [Klebsiella pneumoniae 30684/NJST258_2]|uniref:Uncharacterized protein n=1 Tax=Klebsiella pneumoniae 30684/NJST258_2 TaxID=1420013 RepID=W8UED9_KLEPN|nr:hypothetical protein KPNJ2_00625 [Klebsiella pneumoniae 30684/NJST258_2]